MSAETNRSPSQSRNSVMDTSSDINPRVGAPGNKNELQEGDAPTSDTGQDASQVGDEGDEEAVGRKKNEAGQVEETGYFETHVQSDDNEADSQELWIRQLPTLNAREVKAETTLPQFQRNTISAQGGTAVPRAYRSVVKSYFIELGKLTGGGN